MSQFEKFFKSLSFQMLTHGVILVLIGFNIFYLLDIQACQNYNLSLSTKNSSLTRELEQIENQEAYQNSQLFQDKEIKQRNYKNKGEQIIDLSLVEKQPVNSATSYIPSQVVENSNLKKWSDIILHGKYLNDLRC